MFVFVKKTNEDRASLLAVTLAASKHHPHRAGRDGGRPMFPALKTPTNESYIYCVYESSKKIIAQIREQYENEQKSN